MGLSLRDITTTGLQKDSIMAKATQPVGSLPRNARMELSSLRSKQQWMVNAALDEVYLFLKIRLCDDNNIILEVIYR